MLYLISALGAIIVAFWVLPSLVIGGFERMVNRNPEPPKDKSDNEKKFVEFRKQQKEAEEIESRRIRESKEIDDLPF